MKIQPNYFLYHMPTFEIDALIEEYNNQFKNNWNQTSILVQAFTGTPLKFSWNKEELSAEEIKQKEQDLFDMFSDKVKQG